MSRASLWIVIVIVIVGHGVSSFASLISAHTGHTGHTGHSSLGGHSMYSEHRRQTKCPRPYKEDEGITPPWCHHHSPQTLVRGLYRFRARNACDAYSECGEKPSRANGRIPKPANAGSRLTGWLGGVVAGRVRIGARTTGAALCIVRTMLPASPRRRRCV